MEVEKVYIVIRLIPTNPSRNWGIGHYDPKAINYGVYSSQEKADKAIEEFIKEDPNAKFMTESWKVE